jgi:MFS family permease
MFGNIFTTLRANRNLAVFMIAIVLMEVVHGIEAMALLPLYLTEALGSSVTLVGAVISTYLLVDIITRTPAGWLADKWGRKRVVHHYAPFVAAAFLRLIATGLSPLIADLHSPGNMFIICLVSEEENMNE